MLYDELYEKMRSAYPDFQTIIAYWERSIFDERFAELEQTSLQESFWQNPNQATILKELQQLRIRRNEYYGILKSRQELIDLLELFKDDEEELKKISPDVNTLINHIKQFKIALLLDNPHDQESCFVYLNSGAGGTESQDWTDMLLRMYVRFCEKNRLNAKIVDYQAGEEAGIKSATLFVRGTNPYGLLKSEHGIHRLVRISPFDSNKRRHTSFSGVLIVPEMPELEVSIDPNDLRIDTYRAGGAGGQHVNKTDSAVRITHIPTNIVVQCQNERSQLQNKETAMKMLQARLAQKMEQEREEKLKGSIVKKKIEWGSQIRSYVLHPYKMVKDHRTDFESPQPELVLDGELTGFIEAYLIWNANS